MLNLASATSKLRLARAVAVQVAGTETWVDITKKSARELIDAVGVDNLRFSVFADVLFIEAR